MTDREKLLEIMDHYCADCIEDIIKAFFYDHGDGISASRLSRLIEVLYYRLEDKVDQFENTQQIACEKLIVTE